MRKAWMVGVALCLAACSASPADLSANPSPAAPSSVALPQAEYLRLVRDLPWIVDSTDDATLLRISASTCEVLTGEAIRGPMNDPLTYQQWKSLVSSMTDQGMPADQVGSLIVYAVSFGCPEKQATYLPPA